MNNMRIELSESIEVIIKILSASIRNKQNITIYGDNVDWSDILDEANKHNITSLIYSYLARPDSDLNIPESIKEKFRKQYLFELMEHERNYLSFSKVIGKFAAAGIPVIVLKGLVLRNLYPEPCLRSMCDYDILVKPCDIERATDLLVDSGYKVLNDRDKHIVFEHPFYQIVELHRSMCQEDKIDNFSTFEQKAWKDAVPVEINGACALSLDDTSQVIYLVVHMATHIMGGGFGLRQLCDLVLLIESSKIDWDEFSLYISLMNLDTFTKSLLEVCVLLFGLVIPAEWRFENSQSVVINNLVYDILENGVYGKSENDWLTANRMIYYNEGNESKTLIQKLHIYRNLLFPKADKLDIMFEYARKHRILTPIAWVHRLFYFLVRNDINFKEKIAALSPGRAMDIYEKRSLLLKNLRLLKK